MIDFELKITDWLDMHIAVLEWFCSASVIVKLLS